MKYYTHISISFLLALFFTQEILATEVVGSPKGQFAVSSTGAATYTVSIDVPPGIGGMQPQIGITYNSQSGMGNVGWGCNITGVSAITRGAKDIYHDGTAKGMSYGNTDAYYLDGKRLILASGTEGAVGCLYHPEGDPYTDVTIMSNGSDIYFEAKSPDGNTAVYGDNTNSKVTFSSSGDHIASWHLHSITNPVGRSIYYIYNNTDLYPCVSSITYYNGDTTKTCTVNFTYTTLGSAAQKFRLMDVEGKVDKRLTEIQCKVGSTLLRQYLFYCDTLATNSQVKFPHLKQIVEKDSVGNTLRPINLTWDEPSAWEKTATALSLPLEVSHYNMQVTTDNKYLSGDLNSDGITDIITVANVRDTNIGSEYSHYNIFMSSIDSSGNPIYLESDTVRLILEPDGYSQYVGTNATPLVTDFDGDGLNDLIVPLTSTHYNTTQILLRVFYGRLLSPATANKQRGGVINFSHPLNVATCYTAADFHNCGKADFLILEEEGTGFSYNCHWIGGTDSIYNDSVKTSTLTLPYPPKKVFSQDYNGDGLPDLLVLHENGYKLFWNTGVSVGSFPFSNTTGCYVTGSTVKDAKHVFEGDFDGDGLADILTNDDSDSKFYVSYNNGKGTFTKTQVWEHTINNTPKQINGTIIVYDFDHDGKSDVVITDAIRLLLSYTDGTTVWLRSNGSTLAKHHETYHFLNEDMVWSNRILGDFSGDGYPQLVNYGRDLYDGVSSTLGLWKYTDSYTPGTKKVSSVVDGFGRSVSFCYESLTKPSVYQKGAGSAYPLVDVIAPLHVVKTAGRSAAVNGNIYASQLTDTYFYEGLKAHVAGRSLLGFAKTTVANDVMERTVVNETSGWASNDYYVPTCTTTTTYLGSVGSSTHSTTTTTLTVANKNSGTRKNYFTYPSLVTTSGFDNYATTTTCEYDTTKGVPTLEKTVYDSDSTNYKKVAYTYGSTKYGGRWLPTQIVHKQQHPNDAQPFATTQKITYNSTTGLPTQVIDNYGTSLPLTTTNTYNSYGNLTSKTVQGQGLNTVTTNYSYDSSNRFVAGITTTPASTVTTYTHDLWGNVLTETDATVASNPLTTTNTYDGFGNLLTSTSPEGIVTTYDICWNSGATQKYYVYKTETGKPYHMDYYDADGRVTYSSTENIDGYEVSEQTVYNSKGQVVRKTSKDGDFEVMEDYSYDDRGRITSARKDYMLEGENGFTTSYAYEGRKVTTTDPNGRMSEKTYDAWGLLTKSKEPIGTVNYRYKSCGKPSSAGTGTGTVMMSYDACGNQTTLSDPDAGTTTYTYNAAGEVVSQTDARGITTTHTRDALNRISKTTIGATEINYAYGTSGNAAQRLISQSTGSYGISYGYDQYGHVTSETRNFGSTSYITSYEYDTNGNLSKTTYPGNVQVTYGYNTAGFETSMAVNGSTVWEHLDYDGYNTREKLGSGTSALRRSTTRDDHRLLTGITLQKVSNSSTLHAMTFTHDAVTGNLTQRTGMIPAEGELFTYDNIDRLVRYQNNNGHWDKILQYGQDGNVEFKTGIGSFGYPPGGKAHAVGNVSNTNGYVSSTDQVVVYNDFGKASEISTAHGTAGRYVISYGPDGQRWQMERYKSSTQNPDTVRYYVGDMEGYKVGSNDPVWFYHIGHGVILRKVGLASNTQPTKYYAFTDHLGSVTRIYNTSGTAVFSAQYDPWGVQTMTTNTIKYNRGYCGHEMLNDFQLINMNGRMYDPYLGRFLSPDNYVQLPTSAQSFNRYSYCLNNPLKYVDPDGEWFGLDDLFIAMTGFTCGYFSNVLRTGKWGGSSLKVGLVSAGMAWLGYNTAGLSTGSVTSQTINYVLSTCTNTAVNTLCPPVTIPINSHFSLSFSPAFGFGEGGLSAGVNIGAEYSNGDFSTSITIGAGSGYKGWFAQANYDDWTVGYGITYYDATTYNGHQLGKQAVGTGKLSYKDYSFTLSNDLFADGRDRWRTSAAELSIGDFSVGTYVVTNWGAQESLYEHKDAKAPLLGEGPLKAWKNGNVLSAPFWVGLRYNAQTYRVGYSSKYVQSLTQNAVHKYIKPTPFFIDYDKMKVGMFSYFGYNNPLTLWNF